MTTARPAADGVGGARFVGDDVVLRACPSGPLLVRGARTVVDGDGVEHDVTRPVVAFCLCAKSRRRPWCDGTHKSIPGLLKVASLDFGGLAVAYDDRVLRPRPWTLAQSHWAAKLMDTAPPGRVLELCCGAGHIGLAAVAGNDRSLLCVDLDHTAAQFCRANALQAGLQDRVEVRCGHLGSVLVPGEEFAVVIADPPWVRAAETGTFPEDPLLAIDGGADGLDVARACLDVVADHLAPGGSCVIQLGTEQQVERLGQEAAARLVLVEQRTFERGVLARLDAR